MFIATSNNSPVPRSIDHYSPVPAASTFPISTSSQTFTSILFTPTTVSYNTPLHTPYSSNPFPQTGPIVFPGSSPVFPYFGTPLSGSGSFKSRGRSSRGTYSGRGRAPRSKRGKITSTTSCQTSPIPSYFWPEYQPSPISSGDSSANDALNLALMPRVFDHFPTSLPLDPLHYDFFTVLRAASPVVTFHCPSPLTQKSFSSVYSISFPHGHDSKPLLVAGIKQ